jgi:hypothetical protein
MVAMKSSDGDGSVWLPPNGSASVPDVMVLSLGISVVASAGGAPSSASSLVGALASENVTLSESGWVFENSVLSGGASDTVTVVCVWASTGSVASLGVGSVRLPVKLAGGSSTKSSSVCPGISNWPSISE